MSNIPIVRMEFESMKHSIRLAMTKEMVRIDSDIQAAIDHYCTAENLQTLINENVKGAVDLAVKTEIQELFRYNASGREAIREAIKEFADEHWGPK